VYLRSSRLWEAFWNDIVTLVLLFAAGMIATLSFGFKIRTEMTMKFIATTHEAARRGARIRAQIPLCIVSIDPADSFSEHCHTLIVNPQGCGVRISRPLEPGTPVRLEELPGGVSVTAKVANCTPLGTEGKYWLVGLALDEPGNVWCIHPAPADWGSMSKPVIAAAEATAPPAKKHEWPYSVFSGKGEAHPGRK
jgi:hypothetical protein